MATYGRRVSLLTQPHRVQDLKASGTAINLPVRLVTRLPGRHVPVASRGAARLVWRGTQPWRLLRGWEPAVSAAFCRDSDFVHGASGAGPRPPRVWLMARRHEVPALPARHGVPTGNNPVPAV